VIKPGICSIHGLPGASRSWAGYPGLYSAHFYPPCVKGGGGACGTPRAAKSPLGAVVGREFADDVLQAIVPLDETTLQAGLVPLVGVAHAYTQARVLCQQLGKTQALVKVLEKATSLFLTRKRNCKASIRPAPYSYLHSRPVIPLFYKGIMDSRKTTVGWDGGHVFFYGYMLQFYFASFTLSLLLLGANSIVGPEALLSACSVSRASTRDAVYATAPLCYTFTRAC